MLCTFFLFFFCFFLCTQEKDMPLPALPPSKKLKETSQENILSSESYEMINTEKQSKMTNNITNTTNITNITNATNVTNATNSTTESTDEVVIVETENNNNNNNKIKEDVLEILEVIMNDLMRYGNALSRRAACCWLLCIVRFAANKVNMIQQSLLKIQNAFTNLLSDSKQFTVECAAKGLAYCYELSNDPKIKQNLVSNLMATLGILFFLIVLFCFVLFCFVCACVCVLFCVSVSHMYVYACV